MWAQVRKYYAATGCFCSYHESHQIAKVELANSQNYKRISASIRSPPSEVCEASTSEACENF